MSTFLDRVTITGADDNTPMQALFDLSAEFPFVEWGILVSKRQIGTSRFPSADWCTRFALASADKPVRVSMHVCGSWVREIFRGVADWNSFPEVRISADRVQLNTHAEEHISTCAVLDYMAARNAKQFIIQLDGVNDHILDAGLSRRLNVAGLFDRSHGAGVLPNTWPVPGHWGTYYGYAGGLGPENLTVELAKIQIAASSSPTDFWIDMEGRVRDADERLDLNKVRSVLNVAKAFIANQRTASA